MISGVVNENIEATIQLVVVGPNGQQQIEAVIDTGFSGFLTLPSSVIASLGLSWLARERLVSAQANKNRFAAYSWSEGQKRLSVSSADTHHEEAFSMTVKPRGCEICKKPIDLERLENDSQTRLCTEHARKIQKFGGEFLITATQERTSKEKSLKRTYGSVSVQMTARNHEALRKLREEYEEEQDQIT